MTHQVQGEWMRADNSTNTLEVAPTEQDGVFAIRDTYDQREVIFATDKQIKSLVNAVENGRLKLANR